MESAPANQPDDLWKQKVLTETFKLVCQAAEKPGYDNLKLVSGSLIAMGGQGIHLVTPATIEPLLVEKLTGRHTDNVGYLIECMTRLQDIDQNDYQKSVEKSSFFEHVSQLIQGYFVSTGSARTTRVRTKRNFRKIGNAPWFFTFCQS